MKKLNLHSHWLYLGAAAFFLVYANFSTKVNEQLASLAVCVAMSIVAFIKSNRKSDSAKNK